MMESDSKKAIRKYYEEKGVEAYYKENGASYQNPHFSQIKSLLVANQYRIDYNNVLDFCCGSGEVSLILKELGYPNSKASDPYTQDAYIANMGKPCAPWSFNQVVRGELEGEYSAIICSFAMHLCEKEKLYPLVYQLLQHSPMLVILSPHKRPDLRTISCCEFIFEDFSLTSRGKKVYLKAYSPIP